MLVIYSSTSGFRSSQIPVNLRRSYNYDWYDSIIYLVVFIFVGQMSIHVGRISIIMCFYFCVCVFAEFVRHIQITLFDYYYYSM